MKKFFSLLQPYWKSFILKLGLPLVGFLILISFFGSNSIIAQNQRKKKIKNNKKNIEFLEEDINRIGELLSDLENNPFIIEKTVREKYHQKKEDEDVFLIINEKKEIK